LTIKHIEYVLANNKNELIQMKYSRFTRLNTSKCQEDLIDDTLWDIINDTDENLKPYDNPKQVQQRGKPSTKRKQNEVHQQKLNHLFNPVSATVNKDVMMLLEGERCARGNIANILKNDRVVVKCNAVRQGFNMPNNGQKVL